MMGADSFCFTFCFVAKLGMSIPSPEVLPTLFNERYLRGGVRCWGWRGSLVMGSGGSLIEKIERAIVVAYSH